ncbi:hypothetical protein CsSME_00005957 [Camellia sinensis var. sinensis]
MAAESCVANAKYTYIHDNHKGSLETLDSHHVCCSKKQCKGIHCIPLCSSSRNNCLLSLSPTGWINSCTSLELIFKRIPCQTIYLEAC